MQESPGLNPEWVGEIKFFSVKKVDFVLKWDIQKVCYK